MPKVIWMIQQYGTTPDTGMGGRCHGLAMSLTEEGHAVHVICSRNHHYIHRPDINKKKPWLEKTRFGYIFVRLRSFKYKNNQSLLRILNWFVFTAQIIWGTSKIKKPDIIIYSSPSPIGHWGAYYVAKKCNAQLVFEERDFWPLTLSEIGQKPAKHPLLQFMQYTVKHAYKVSALVTATFPGAYQHLERHGVAKSKFLYLPNGILDTESQCSQELPSTLSTLLNFESLNETFNIGYVGSFGIANALDTVLDAAALLRDIKGIRFVMVGSGGEQARLHERIVNENLTNVVIHPPIAKETIPAFLEHCSAGIISWNDSPLYNFGTSANKLFDYFNAGIPVLQAFSGNFDLVSCYKAGLTTAAKDPIALATSIRTFVKMPLAERQQFGTNGKRAIEEKYNYRSLARELLTRLRDIEA